MVYCSAPLTVRYQSHFFKPRSGKIKAVLPTAGEYSRLGYYNVCLDRAHCPGAGLGIGVQCCPGLVSDCGIGVQCFCFWSALGFDVVRIGVGWSFSAFCFVSVDCFDVGVRRCSWKHGLVWRRSSASVLVSGYGTGSLLGLSWGFGTAWGFDSELSVLATGCGLESGCGGRLGVRVWRWVCCRGFVWCQGLKFWSSSGFGVGLVVKVLLGVVVWCQCLAWRRLGVGVWCQARLQGMFLCFWVSSSGYGLALSSMVWHRLGVGVRLRLGVGLGFKVCFRLCRGLALGSALWLVRFGVRIGVDDRLGVVLRRQGLDWRRLGIRVHRQAWHQGSAWRRGLASRFDVLGDAVVVLVFFLSLGQFGFGRFGLLGGRSGLGNVLWWVRCNF